MDENQKDTRILIVDDTPKNIQVLVGILKVKGYQLNVANNGLKALEMVEKVLPDLILLDVMMPELDGYETCRRLKSSPITREIPIIFLTAKIETEDIVHGFELGAVDYVTKPFNAKELLVRVNTHLQLRAAQIKVEQQKEQLEVLANKLSKYLSPQVYASIFSGEKDVKIATMRKTLTVFFSDIVGFTPKTESMEHQALTQWLNHYLNEMADITLRFGGTLDKFVGDSVMVFFGDPTTLGEIEDAHQCLLMAIEMRKRAKKLGVNIRIGIHSGECTVGNFGSNERMEYTIIGKVVNMASRLEQNGEPGKILISQSTYELVKDIVHCESREKIRVKGIEQEVMSYWVTDSTG